MGARTAHDFASTQALEAAALELVDNLSGSTLTFQGMGGAMVTPVVHEMDVDDDVPSETKGLDEKAMMIFRRGCILALREVIEFVLCEFRCNTEKP